MNRNTTKKGFSLVELIVVIGIIAILTTIVTVAIEGNLKKSRDSKRIADLEQIALALEVYKEANGAYPSHAGGVEVTSVSEIEGILRIPKDPLDKTGFKYYYDSSVTCPASGKVAVYAVTLEVETPVSDCATPGSFPSGDAAPTSKSQILILN